MHKLHVLPKQAKKQMAGDLKIHADCKFNPKMVLVAHSGRITHRIFEIEQENLRMQFYLLQLR